MHLLFRLRYIDDIFMTTNESLDAINLQLDKAKRKDVNIEIESTIDASINYLDIGIINENGRLRTSIYHKPTAEPYVLPYTSDHPRHVHRNIPYAALLRAARLCTNVTDLNDERVRIDMSLLLNGYPPHFITVQFDRFFGSNRASAVVTSFDAETYRQLHYRLVHMPTRREKQLQSTMVDPVKAPTVLQTKLWDRQILYLRYRFDSGLSVNFPKHFFRWWNAFYRQRGSPVRDVKVKLVPTTNPTLEQYFIHKKPSKEMLTRMEPLRLT